MSICESCQELEMKREWVQTLGPLTILKLITHEKQSTTEVVIEVQTGKSWAGNRFFGLLFHTFIFFLISSLASKYSTTFIPADTQATPCWSRACVAYLQGLELQLRSFFSIFQPEGSNGMFFWCVFFFLDQLRAWGFLVTVITMGKSYNHGMVWVRRDPEII